MFRGAHRWVICPSQVDLPGKLSQVWQASQVLAEWGVDQGCREREDLGQLLQAEEDAVCEQVYVMDNLSHLKFSVSSPLFSS